MLACIQVKSAGGPTAVAQHGRASLWACFLLSAAVEGCRPYYGRRSVLPAWDYFHSVRGVERAVMRVDPVDPYRNPIAISPLYATGQGTGGYPVSHDRWELRARRYGNKAGG